MQPPFQLRNSKCCSVSSFHRIFKWLAKALISLRVCAGWSEPLLVAHTTLHEQKFESKLTIIFLPISLNMRFWCSKEPSHWDRSFEYPQCMFWLRSKKNNFSNRHSYLEGWSIIGVQLGRENPNPRGHHSMRKWGLSHFPLNQWSIFFSHTIQFYSSLSKEYISF